MERLNTFQRNNLTTGTLLAAEIQPSSPELRAFVVIGAYRQTESRFIRDINPSKFLNADQSDLRFWIRKYEVNKHLIEINDDITNRQLMNAIFIKDIQSIEQLEEVLATYIEDFSIMIPS